MQTALVVIVNNRDDWRRIQHEGWYRIPQRRAPLPLAAEVLAFYFTSAFDDDACSIACFAPALGYRLVRRRDLLPEQAMHPRAAEWYYRVELGAVRRLARPVRSRRLRRVVFIPTTMETLLVAADVADLWRAGEAEVLAELFPDLLAKAAGRPAIEPHLSETKRE